MRENNIKIILSDTEQGGGSYVCYSASPDRCEVGLLLTILPLSIDNTFFRQKSIKQLFVLFFFK